MGTRIPGKDIQPRVYCTQFILKPHFLSRADMHQHDTGTCTLWHFIKATCHSGRSRAL